MGSAHAFRVYTTVNSVYIAPTAGDITLECPQTEDALPDDSRAGVSTISVVIATRDRGDVAARAVASILRDTSAQFDLVVVDQSRDDETLRALEPFRDDERLTVVP